MEYRSVRSTLELSGVGRVNDRPRRNYDLLRSDATGRDLDRRGEATIGRCDPGVDPSVADQSLQTGGDRSIAIHQVNRLIGGSREGSRDPDFRSVWSVLEGILSSVNLNGRIDRSGRRLINGNSGWLTGSSAAQDGESEGE